MSDRLVIPASVSSTPIYVSAAHLVLLQYASPVKDAVKSRHPLLQSVAS